MIFFYWILVFLYMILLLVYNVTVIATTDDIPAWPILTKKVLEDVHILACSHHSDCPTTHACLARTCIPKFLRGNRCQPQRGGEWQSYHYLGGTFAICICTKPHLFHPKHFGGDCDVSVACGRHGTLDDITGKCVCDRGYREGPHFTCQKIPIFQLIDCEDHERPIHDVEGYHPDYLAKLRHVRCVPKPCTVDPLSGNVLHHALYSPHRGCVCDPRYGLFGARLLRTHARYLDSSHTIDACMSIFKTEPIVMHDSVELYQYFYIGQLAPITILRFQRLTKEDIIPELQDHVNEEGHLMIQQSWPFNYVQYILREEKFLITTPYCKSYVFSKEMVTFEVEHEKYAPCHILVNARKKYVNPNVLRHDWIYYELNRFPVCEILSDYNYAQSLFWNTIVLNPLHLRDALTSNDACELIRSNGLILTYDLLKGTWILNLAKDYNVSFYQENVDHTNAPGVTLPPEPDSHSIATFASH